MNKLVATLAATALVGGAVSSAGYAAAGQDRSSAGDRKVVEVDDARLKFEINATDGDGGVQLFLDAEQWRRISLFAPDGRRIFTAKPRGIMARQGGTELFLESAEPSFDELPLAGLLDRWPAGKYKVRGRGLEGQRYVGTARLSHHLPDGPELVSPVEGDGRQDPDHTVVRWRGVPPADGSPIIAYQVLVVADGTGLRALPTRTLDVMMPPTATRLRVPKGFLQPGTEYEWEVLAIEKTGNQTLSASTFTTKR
jgi:hypothetical protein